MSQENNTQRLKDMRPNYAWTFCIKLTEPIWITLGYKDNNRLWEVIKAYVLNNYQDKNISVPDNLREAWNRCKELIDREAGK